ncbi:MAG: hypothetical protein U0003_00385 [Vampirovibrionales bacterium]
MQALHATTFGHYSSAATTSPKAHVCHFSGCCNQGKNSEEHPPKTASRLGQLFTLTAGVLIGRRVLKKIPLSGVHKLIHSVKQQASPYFKQSLQKLNHLKQTTHQFVKTHQTHAKAKIIHTAQHYLNTLDKAIDR